MLSADDVGFVYEERRGRRRGASFELEGVSLSVARGEIVGILDADHLHGILLRHGAEASSSIPPEGEEVLRRERLEDLRGDLEVNAVVSLLLEVDDDLAQDRIDRLDRTHSPARGVEDAGSGPEEEELIQERERLRRVRSVLDRRGMERRLREGIAGVDEAETF